MGFYIFLAELCRLECVSLCLLCHCRTPSVRKENLFNTYTLTRTHTRIHTQSRLSSLVFVSCRPSCSDPSLPSFLALPSPFQFLLLLSSLRSWACFWVSDVLFGGFRPVSGSGPAASVPLLYPGQPAAAVSNGGNHLHPAGPPGPLHLVLWWTWRRRTAGE